MPCSNLTVFHGHGQQDHHHMTGHIAHHAARSLISTLPAPDSQEKPKFGRFPFLCHNFCGDDHENMSGVFIVEA